MTGLEQFLTALSGATSQFGERFYENKNLQMLDEQLRSRMGLQHGFNKENIVLTGDTQTKTNLDTAKGEQTLTDEVMAERLAAIPGMGVDPAAARNYEAQVRGFTPFRQQFVPMPHGSTTTDLGDGTTGVQAGPQQWDPNAKTFEQEHYLFLMQRASQVDEGGKPTQDALQAKIEMSRHPLHGKMGGFSAFDSNPSPMANWGAGGGTPPVQKPKTGVEAFADYFVPGGASYEATRGVSPFDIQIPLPGTGGRTTTSLGDVFGKQPAKPAKQPQAGETAKPEIKGFKPEWEDEYQKMIAEDGVPDTPANRSFFMGMKNGR